MIKNKKVAFVVALHQSKLHRPNGFELFNDYIGSVYDSCEYPFKVFAFDNQSDHKFEVENQPDNWKEQIASEIGDVLWYCAALANDLNMPLAMIASLNEKKLRDRFDRGKINGSGDNR